MNNEGLLLTDEEIARLGQQYPSWSDGMLPFLQAQDTKTLRVVGGWLSKNKELFLGNFRAGDNFDNLVQALLCGKMPEEVKDG